MYGRFVQSDGDVASSLSGRGAQLWSQNSKNVAGTAEKNDAFGRTLAAGDVNGDGRDDLAVGVPLEALHARSAAGAVNVLYGGGPGLAATANQLWSQDSTSILDASESLDQFGGAVAIGDVNGDGFGDLAVGAPNESTGAGAVHVIYGSATGLHATANQMLSGPTGGFGTSLAIGDFGGSGDVTDLVVGSPLVATETGQIGIYYGTPTGITTTPDTVTETLMGDTPEQGDLFGWSLVAGNYGGSSSPEFGLDDIAAGAPAESLSVSGQGAVGVVANDGGSGRSYQFISQAGPIAGDPEVNGGFGSSLG